MDYGRHGEGGGDGSAVSIYSYFGLHLSGPRRHLSKRQEREQYLAPLSRHEYNFLLNMKEAKLEQNRLSNQRSSKNVTEILTNNDTN
jgi:hypothetical protein